MRRAAPAFIQLQVIFLVSIILITFVWVNTVRDLKGVLTFCGFALAFVNTLIIIIWIPKALILRKRYLNTFFYFYEDRFEYLVDFIGRDAKTIFYNDIIEFELISNLFQRLLGLGTIVVSTAGSGIGSGVEIFDIPRPVENYSSIKGIIDQWRQNNKGKEKIMEETKTPEEASQYLFNVQPTYVLMLMLVRLFFVGCVLLLVSTPALVKTDIIRLDTASVGTWAAIVLSIIVGVGLIWLIYRYLVYRNTRYQIFEDRIHFDEGFLVIEKKDIQVRNIREVTLMKSIFQRLFNLGTVVITTAATSNYRGMAGSGLRLMDLEKPDDIYRSIQKLLRTKRIGNE